MKFGLYKRKIEYSASGVPQPVFKIVYRDEFDCVHDTGVGHSVSMPCEVAELMAEKVHLRSDDPLHEELWHED